MSRINCYSQGSSAVGYTVRATETLALIAANLWGDSSLRYKLAEANGLCDQGTLSDGHSIRSFGPSPPRSDPSDQIICLRQTGRNASQAFSRTPRNVSTFQPYDPSDTIGDTAPTAAKPPKKNKCGVFGQVLLVVVAVAVAVVTKNLALGAEIFKAGTAAAAITTGVSAGVAGSVASQAVGVATGIQEKFSWHAVAQAAISGGVGGGVGLESASGWGQAAANAAVQNIASQGIGVALGLQKKFSWASVAAAGVSGGVGFKAGKQLGNHFGGGKIGEAATTAFVATASSIAHAATRSAIEGSNFGDNLQASIPDIIGQALGGAIAGTMAGWSSKSAAMVSKDNTPQGTSGIDGMEVPSAVGRPGFVYEESLEELFGGFSTLSSGPDYSIMLAAYQAAEAARNGYIDSRNELRLPTVVVTAQKGGSSWRYATSNFARLNAIGAQERQTRADDARRYYGETASWRANLERSQAFTENAYSLQGGQVGVLGGLAAATASWSVNVLPRAIVNHTATGLESLASLALYADPLGGGTRVAFGLQTGNWASFSGALPRIAYRSGEAVMGAQTETAVMAVDVAFGIRAVMSIGSKAAGLSAAGIGCFAAGTLVHTKAGLKPIEDVQPGDFVLAQPEFQGARGWRRVNEVFRRDPQEMLHVDVGMADGRTEIIKATTEHPFWVSGKGWTGANALVPGDTLELADGGAAYVTSVTPSAAPEPVFNFSVDGFHTYYVGTRGVWVHNASFVGQIGKLETPPGGILTLEQALASPRPGIIGQFAPSPHLNFGTTLFGQEAHMLGGRIVIQRLDELGIPPAAIIDRTAPGLTGVDLRLDPRLAARYGIGRYIEIKPHSSNGLATADRQRVNWGYPNRDFQVVTYDQYGNVIWLK